jgi:hypothetical protein
MTRIGEFPRSYRRVAYVALALGGAGVAGVVAGSPHRSTGSERSQNEALSPEGQSDVNAINITNAKKTSFVYHEDGSRTYQVTGTGYEFADGDAKDLCGVDGQFVSVVSYRGLDVLVENNDYPKNACDDGRLTPDDFKR